MAQPIALGYLIPTREAVMSGDVAAAPLIALAERAERSGYDSVWAGDSIVARARHDPLTLLPAVAARTSRVTLGTAVLLPNRHPLRLAQEVGTLWRLAPERLLLGLGLGVGPGNFEPLGFDYHTRLELFEEIAEVLRGLPATGPLHHQGTHFPFEDLEINPQPGARVPLYYGGVSRAAVAMTSFCRSSSSRRATYRKLPLPQAGSSTR